MARPAPSSSGNVVDRARPMASCTGWAALSAAPPTAAPFAPPSRTYCPSGGVLLQDRCRDDEATTTPITAHRATQGGQETRGIRMPDGMSAETVQPPFVRIEDPADPRVAVFSQLRDRDLARQRGLFIAEGALVVRRLIEESPLQCVSMLVSQRRLGALSREIAALARRWPGAPVYVAPQQVMDAIAGFHIHRGVLAAGRRPEPQPLHSLLAQLPTPAPTVLALEGLTNHDNVGGVFRNAAAFGADLVALDERTCDPLYRKAVRVSIGCALTVPWTRVGSIAGEGGALQRLGEAGFVSLALTPDPDAQALDDALEELAPDAPVALLCGEEGPGLSARALAQADLRVRIPIRRDRCDSLNVAVAAAVALHALWRQRRRDD